MTESMDELLNAIKREYQEESSTPEISETLETPVKPPAQDSGVSQGDTLAPAAGLPNDPSAAPSDQSIDALLADMGMEPSSPASPSTSPRPLPNPFPTVTSSSSDDSSAVPGQPSLSKATHHLLSQVKSHYDAEQSAAEQARAEKLEADRRLQRQLEAQRQQDRNAAQDRQRQQAEVARAARLKRAERWLADLDPNSEEGFWFESFSLNYASKLEAALEYLEALA